LAKIALSPHEIKANSYILYSKTVWQRSNDQAFASQVSASLTQ
jgi:hypothetical protein